MILIRENKPATITAKATKKSIFLNLKELQISLQWCQLQLITNSLDINNYFLLIAIKQLLSLVPYANDYITKQLNINK